MKEAQLIPAKPMLFQCPLCKEMSRLTDFQTSTQGLEVRCSECEGVFFYEQPPTSTLSTPTSAVSPQPAQKKVKPASGDQDSYPLGAIPAPSAPKAPQSIHKVSKTTSTTSDLEPTRSCPKCGHVNPQSRKSCIKCGLDFEKAAELDFQNTLHSNPAIAERADALWKEVLNHWEDPRVHERFLTLCSAYGMYQVAGRLYREQQEKRPGDPMAMQQLERLVDVAHVQMVQQFHKTKNKNEIGSGLKWAVVAFLFFGGGLVIFLFMRYLDTMMKSIP